MFFAVKENTLNEEKFLSICHECGYEPYLYNKRDDDKILSKKYIVSLNTPKYSLESEENIVIVFYIKYNKNHLRNALFEKVFVKKKIYVSSDYCYRYSFYFDDRIDVMRSLDDIPSNSL